MILAFSMCDSRQYCENEPVLSSFMINQRRYRMWSRNCLSFRSIRVSLRVFSDVRVAQSFIFYVVFCGSLTFTNFLWCGRNSPVHFITPMNDRGTCIWLKPLKALLVCWSAVDILSSCCLRSVFFLSSSSITYLSPLEGHCFSRSSAYQWVRIVPLF